MRRIRVETRPRTRDQSPFSRVALMPLFDDLAASLTVSISRESQLDFCPYNNNNNNTVVYISSASSGKERRDSPDESRARFSALLGASQSSCATARKIGISAYKTRGQILGNYRPLIGDTSPATFANQTVGRLLLARRPVEDDCERTDKINCDRCEER